MVVFKTIMCWGVAKIEFTIIDCVACCSYPATSQGYTSYQLYQKGDVLWNTLKAITKWCQRSSRLCKVQIRTQPFLTAVWEANSSRFTFTSAEILVSGRWYTARSSGFTFTTDCVCVRPWQIMLQISCTVMLVDYAPNFLYYAMLAFPGTSFVRLPKQTLLCLRGAVLCSNYAHLWPKACVLWVIHAGKNGKSAWAWPWPEWQCMW